MLRRFLAGLVIVGLFAGIALAEDFKATVKKVDAEKNSITLMVDDEEKTFEVSKDADIYASKMVKKKETKETVSGGLGAIKENAKIAVTTIMKGDKDIVVAIKLEGAAKKKKKDK